VTAVEQKRAKCWPFSWWLARFGRTVRLRASFGTRRVTRHHCGQSWLNLIQAGGKLVRTVAIPTIGVKGRRPAHRGRALTARNSGTYSRMLNERSDPCNVGTKMVSTVV
jgi:hypothetical protein